MTNTHSLQQHYAPNSICYGCGPANDKGLHVESFVEGDSVLAYWTPQPHHQAFPGVLNGGIIGSILDCHCNWAACWYLMQHNKLKTPPSTVTAEYHIKLLKPTPVNCELKLIAKLTAIKNNKADISAVLLANDYECAHCDATFVAVNADHPAFHRW